MEVMEVMVVLVLVQTTVVLVQSVVQVAPAVFVHMVVLLETLFRPSVLFKVFLLQLSLCL
jgi:hypothetical protein